MSARYAEYLARCDYEAVGFIPRPRLEMYEAAGQILVEKENDEPCGVVVFGNGWPTLRIYQAIVQYDARRRERGLHLVERTIAEAKRRGCELVSLWCADDLPSNEFWKAAGFTRLQQRAGGATRQRKHHLWILHVDSPQMRLFAQQTTVDYDR